MEPGKMFNHELIIDINKYPKELQDIIKELEKFDEAGEWVLYDSKFMALENQAKMFLRHNVISETDFNNLLKKYGWYV